MHLKKIIFPLLLFLVFQYSSAQEITLFPGFWSYQYYQDDKRIPRKDVVMLLEKDTVAFEHWKKSNTYSTLSYTAFTAELGFFAWQLSNISKDKESTPQLVGVLGSFAVGLTFALISNSQRKKAILNYNEGLNQKTTFRITPSKNGFGIALNF